MNVTVTSKLGATWELRHGAETIAIQPGENQVAADVWRAIASAKTPSGASVRGHVAAGVFVVVEPEPAKPAKGPKD